LRDTRARAERGDAAAQYKLGLMYGEGEGVARDDAQAVAWYRKAAGQGYALAQAELGVMYKDGRGVAQDDTQAVAW
jgi:TPR repeat protein